MTEHDTVVMNRGSISGTFTMEGNMLMEGHSYTEMTTIQMKTSEDYYGSQTTLFFVGKVNIVGPNQVKVGPRLSFGSRPKIFFSTNDFSHLETTF